jgi:hypothetical protein
MVEQHQYHLIHQLNYYSLVQSSLMLLELVSIREMSEILFHTNSKDVLLFAPRSLVDHKRNDIVHPLDSQQSAK